MNQTFEVREMDELLKTLEVRFTQHMPRHEGLQWSKVAKQLQSNPRGLWSLQQMECSGGEPDVVGSDTHTGALIFYDCATESPKARRSLCYDDDALESRKENKPKGSVMGMATKMGVQLLTVADYNYLQQLGAFDTKTSSWVETKEDIRNLGGALFGDRRYNTVFLYHNGAESYYAARGFRSKLLV